MVLETFYFEDEPADQEVVDAKAYGDVHLRCFVGSRWGRFWAERIRGNLEDVRGLPVMWDSAGLVLIRHEVLTTQRTIAIRSDGWYGHDVIVGKDVRATAPVPRVTFTDPQVCAVGPIEAQARAAGIDVRVVTYPTGNVSGASTLGRGVKGTSQLVVDEARRVVVGATFTGPGVAELLHSATIAIVGAVPLDTLWHAVPSFPTVSEVWLRLLEAYGL